MERQPGVHVVLQALEPAGRALLERWVYVLVLSRGEFVVPYTAERLAALREGGEYEPDFFAFLQRFLAALAQPGWPPGNYFPGGWYRMLKAQGQDLAQAAIEPDRLGPFFGEEAHVDARGRWRVGSKSVTGRVLDYFLRHLQFDPELRRYFIRYQNVNYPEVRYLRHESPPFRVRAVAFGQRAAQLTLNDGTHEPLRPGSLRLDKGEALYCAVKPAGLPAWFEDSARFQVLDRVAAHDTGFVLRLGAGNVPLALDDPWAGADGLPGA